MNWHVQSGQAVQEASFMSDVILLTFCIEAIIHSSKLYYWVQGKVFTTHASMLKVCKHEGRSILFFCVRSEYIMHKHFSHRHHTTREGVEGHKELLVTVVKPEKRYDWMK